MNDPDLAPVESGFGKKTFNRILKALRKYRVLAIRPGWEQTPDGVIPPPAMIGEAGGDSFPWQITITSAEDSKVTIEAGTILKSNDDLSDTLTRNSPTEEFTVSAGGFLAIKIIDHEPEDYDIEEHSSWPIADDKSCSVTAVDEELGIYQFDYRLLPIWVFVGESEKEDTDVAINDELWARRCLQHHLVIEDGFYKLSSGSRITVPILKPSVMAIP